MRSDVIRIYKVVHTWTGIVAGMALFIAFYAGSLTMFKSSLEAWAAPPVATRSVPLAEAQPLLTDALRRHPESAREIRVDLAPDAKDRVAWEVMAEGADEHDRLSVRHFVATLEGSGEVERTHIGELVDVLHRVVGLPVDGDVSRIFMGIIATLYAVAIASGVIILLPSLVKDLFALRVGPNLKRMWLDAHNVVGLFSLPFHVVMAITAAVFAFHDGIYAVQDRMIHEGKLAVAFQGRGAPPSAPPRDPGKMLPPTELVSRVTAIAPGFEPTMLQYLTATGPRATVRVWGHDARALEHRPLGGFAIVDPYQGKIVSTDYLPGQQGRPAAVITGLFALHFGTYGGDPMKWGYFLLGLLGAWLFYSGNLLWIETRRKKAKRAAKVERVQTRNTFLMASATVGVCLGSICGISFALLASKWLHGHVVDTNAWNRHTYYAVFFGAIAWAFWRGGARASVDLLRLAGGAALAIPATSLLAKLVPALGMWAHGSTDALGVDLTALALGLVFLRLAQVTRRRVHEGPKDSVWSIHGNATLRSAPER